MRLSPTGLGAKGGLFFAAVVLLFFATPYSNLFFLLTSFLAILGALGVTGSWRNLRGASAELLAIEPAPAGSPHPMRVRITMPTGRRAFGVLVHADAAGKSICIAELPVVSDGETVTAALKGMPRGAHAIERLRIRSRHPFGVCMAEQVVTVRGEAIAYPTPALPEDPSQRGRGGDGNRPPGGDEESLAGLRDWRDGDSLRQIHWKATARRGSPIVKEYERHGGEGVDLVIDRRCDAAALERALSIATRLVLDAAKTKQALRLRSQDADLALDADRPEPAPLLRWLATASTLPHDAVAPPAASQRAQLLTVCAGGAANA
jgi:uncharacterized protein (DUF58 family)